MIGYTSYQELALQIPEYDTEVTGATMKIDILDGLLVGKFQIAGKLGLEMEDGEVIDILDASELVVMIDDHEVPYAILSDKPTFEQIIEAINQDIDAWEGSIH
jgi:hypothetical protein